MTFEVPGAPAAYDRGPGRPNTSDVIFRGGNQFYAQAEVPVALKQFGIDLSTQDGRAQLGHLLTPHLPVCGQLPSVPTK